VSGGSRPWSVENAEQLIGVAGLVGAENVIWEPQAASSYSWMMPPSRSDFRRCTGSGGEVSGGAGAVESGAF
jgi:hypothetical protein